MAYNNSDVRVLGDVELAGALSFEKNYSEFPVDPKPRTIVVKDGVTYIYTELSNNSGFWSWQPIGAKHSAYLHTQGVDSAVWTVNHGLNATDFAYFVYDSNHTLMLANIEIVDSNTARIILSSAMMGTAVFFSIEYISSQVINAAESITVGTITLRSTNGALTANAAPVALASDVTSAIAVETAARQAADAVLSGQISSIISNTDAAALDSLSELVTAFQAADSNLTSSISALGTNASSALAAETTARTTADATNAAAIAAEISARQAADGINAAAIAAETTARTTADAVNEAAVVAEIAARQAADAVNATAITTEAANRAAAVSAALSSAVTTASNDATAKVLVETNNRISADATTLASANTYADSAVATEVTARTTAVTAAISTAASDATTKANAAQAAAIAASTPIAHVGSGGTAHANVVAGGAAGFMTGADKTKLDAVTGTNTGDETTATIKTKLGISTLSGSNTGDQTTVTGNAGTATTLQTARNIAGVSFNGSADIAIPYANLTGLPTLGTAAAKDIPATGNASATQVVYGTDTRLSDSRVANGGNAATVTTNANLTGVVTSTGNATAIAAGAITNTMLANSAVANLSGTNTGDQTTITGNAGTATKLATARTINGVAFDGSAAITINAVDSTARVASSLLGVANGVATLDASGLVPSAQLPSYVDDVLEYTNLAGFPTTGTTGKIYVALDTNKTYRWSGSAYVYITSGAVDSVAGKTGVVTLVKGDVGLGNVDNTSDVSKPVSTAQQTALDLKANLASPAFTGVPTATTAAVNNSTTQIATTAFVNAEIANDAAPIAHVGSGGTAHANVVAAGAAGFMTGADKTKLDAVTGTNTGDETTATVKTKLGISTLSGSNTGDQTITLTGGVTGSGTGSFAATVVTNANLTGVVTSTGNATAIAAGAITNTMLANSAVANLSGTNTGDETLATIKTKLGISTLSGSNTGDQTLSGLGGQPLDADLTAIAALVGTTGLLKKTAADTWTLDTTAYTTNTGTVTGVTGTAPIVSSGGTAPAISISAATTIAAGSMSAADKTKLDAISGTNTGDQTTITGNAGTATTLQTARAINGVSFNGSAAITVTANTTNALTIGTGLSGTSFNGSSAVTIANTGILSITGTAPVSASTTSGATTISMAAANTSTNGYLTSADWNTFNGKQPAGSYLTSSSGAAAISVVIVSTTTQAATANNHYVLTNVSSTTVTLPASPASGDTVWVTVANSLATNVIARNAQTIMYLAEDLTINSQYSTVQLRFVNSSWRILNY